MSDQAILGIDVAKKKLDVFLILEESTVAGQFGNSNKGLKSLKKWLTSHGADKVHACLESTGSYGKKVCYFLHDQGHRVSVVNPLRVKRYAESRLKRNKTDKADARIIAEFCRNEHPRVWSPPSEEVERLQSLMRRIEALENMRSMESNRLESAPGEIKQSIKRIITSLDKEIDEVRKLVKQHFDDHPGLKHQLELLETIPAIAEKTARKLLSEIEFSRYKQARQVSAQSGVTPRRDQSGTSLNRTRLSKLGNPRIRKALYFPAIVAKKHNPIVKQFAERLERNGKSPKQITCASMRKLLHIAFGVLKNDRPFDPTMGFSA